MSQTWKTIVAIVITAAIVGSGVYFWQQNKEIVTQAPASEFDESLNTATLYRDDDYRIQFTTDKACKNYFSVKIVNGRDEAAARYYEVFLPGSTSWPKDSAWYGYSIYTQKAYDDLIGRALEMPETPVFELALDSGKLLTKWSPQDGPTDLPNCEVKVEKF